MLPLLQRLLEGSVPFLLGALTSAWVAARSAKIQRAISDEKESRALILDVIKDTEILFSHFIFNGVYCPQIESNSPYLTMHGGEDGMSYAERSFQIRLCGMKIIENSSKLLLLNPKRYKELILKISSLKDYLDFKEPGKKQRLEFMIGHMISNLHSSHKDTPLLSQDFTEKLEEHLNGIKRLNRVD